MSFFEDIEKGLEEAIEIEGGRKLHKINTVSLAENGMLIVAFEKILPFRLMHRSFVT